MTLGPLTNLAVAGNSVYVDTIDLALRYSKTSQVIGGATSKHVSETGEVEALNLTTGKVQPTADARFVILAASKGSVWVNLVSLFPPTFNNRANGNRPDIMQILADMHPSFLRFPG